MNQDQPKKAQGPRLIATKPKRGLLSWLGFQKNPSTREAGKPGTTRPHCPGARTAKHPTRTTYSRDRGWETEVTACAGCGEVVQEREIETNAHYLDDRTAANRSRKVWRKYRRKHGKLKRGW
jgi:hypothetical protein